MYRQLILKCIACILFALTARLLPAQCVQPVPAKVPLGANLNELTDYSRDRPFNNVFKLSRPMSGNIQQPFNFSPISLDATGWPLQDFGVVVMTEMDSTMGGTYTIQFKGQATISPVSGSSFTVTNKTYNAASNITTASLVYQAHINNGGTMFIGFTNTHFSATIAGIKDIKIMKPGLSVSAQTFSQQFLNHLGRFDCLRFMDWHETNNNNDSLWANRTTRSFPSQQVPNGVTWEYVIQLANTLDKDVWINVPHKAHNNYVTSLARLFRDSLKPSLHIYVEYSNEVWNGQFEQTLWVNDKSFAEGNMPGSAINFDGVNDQFTWRARYVAKRSKEISDIFKTQFGAAELNKRFRVVLPQQFGFFDFTVRGVDFINDFFGKPNKFFYAIAVAPYFATNQLDAANNHATTSQILAELDNQVNIIYNPFNNVPDMWAARAAYYGLQLVAYEGGPDTFGGNNIPAKRDANRNARMRAICRKYLTNWYKYGFNCLFNWYSAGAADYNTPFGTWALTEIFDSSQKLKAIDSIHNFLTPGIVAGRPVTATVDPRKFAGYDSSKLINPFFQPSAGFPLFYEYPLLVPAGKGGKYQVTFQTNANSAGQSYKVLLDDSLLATITPVNNNFGAFVNILVNTGLLAEGLHGLRITPVGGFNFRIKGMLFTRTQVCSSLMAEEIESEAITVADVEPQVYPNPAPGKTAIVTYTLKTACNVSLQVIDINGRVLLTNNAGYQQAGRQQAVINAKNLASSLYFIRLQTGTSHTVLKWAAQ